MVTELVGDAPTSRKDELQRRSRRVLVVKVFGDDESLCHRGVLDLPSKTCSAVGTVDVRLVVIPSGLSF